MLTTFAASASASLLWLTPWRPFNHEASQFFAPTQFSSPQASQTLQDFHQTASAGLRFQVRNISGLKSQIAKTHPEPLDLAENGSLFLIEKSWFGPVPEWRSEFVEVTWLVGTTRISQDFAVEVERVVRAVKRDNVAVELCRSREV
ncbi:hypothetical protein ACFX13_042618 [Malus domestica]